MSHIPSRSCEVEYSDEFGAWWEGLAEDEQVSVAAVVQLLAAHGPTLGAPYSSAIVGSRLGHLRELRIQHAGEPYRVLYAFDPRRIALLLVGGRKTGDQRFYRRMVPRAEVVYDAHLREIERRK